jgi:PAS domain S-box-containing protein
MENHSDCNQLVEIIPDAAIYLDKAGTILSCSSRAGEIAGHRIAELVGQKFTSQEFLTPASSESIKKLLAALIAGEKVTPTELQLKHADGHIATIEVDPRVVMRGETPDGFELIIREINESDKTAQRFFRINECFLNLGTDPDENIRRLTSLCGEMLGAACALYYRFEEGVLYAAGQWNTPSDFNPRIAPDGHICYDVIKSDCDDVLVVRNLQETPYAQTDNNVARYGLKTYIGKAVRCGDKNLGSLCAVYRGDVIPGDAERRLLGMLASAIGGEEDRKRVQEENVKFKLGIERSSEAIFLTDIDGEIVYVNPAFEKIYGFTSQEAIGQTPRILKSNFLSPDTYSQLWKSLLAKNDWSGEFVNRTKDGRFINVEATANPVLDKSGQIIGFIAIQRDITERKRSEKQLRVEKAYLERLIESAPEAVVIVDNDGKILRVNGEFSRMFGYAPEEAEGKSIDKLLAPGELFEEALSLTRASYDQRVNCEAIRYRKDGSPVDVSILGAPVDAGEGQIAIYGIYRDITERKRAEETLRRNERFLQNIFDGIQDGISVLDTDFNIIHANKMMEKWYGHSMPLVGKKCYLAYQGREVPCSKCPTVLAIEKGSLQVECMPLIDKDGETSGCLELFAHPLIDDNGQITGVIEYVRNITERKKAEELNSARTVFLSRLVGLTNTTELAQLTFDHIGNQMPIDAGVIVIKNDLLSSKVYEVVYSFDTDESGIKKIGVERENFDLEKDTITAEVLRSGTRRVIHRTDEEYEKAVPNSANLKMFNQRKSRSLVFLPLKVYGRTFGVLSVQSYRAGAFNETQVAILESVVADLALAVMAVRMTEALREGEERYRIVAEQTGQIIYDYDVISGRISWSGAVAAITGYSLEEFRGVDIGGWVDLVHPDDRTEAVRALDESLRACSRYNVEYRMKCKDGHYIYVEDNGIFLADDSGRAVRMLGTMSDVSEHRRAKELLVQSEEKYRRLIETMPNGLIIADTSGRPLFANPAACKIFGYPLEELIGMDILQSLPAESQQILLKEMEQRITGEQGEYELTIRKKDGELRTIKVNGAPLRDNDGNIMGTSAIFSDITDAKKAETEKLELRDKLARAQRMESLGVLAGGVAHDLNNILGPLVAYPELIRMKLPPNSPITNQITKIESSAQRAADVVQDLLTMARRGRYEMSVIDLNHVIEGYLQSTDFHDLRMRFPTIEVTCDLDPGTMPIYGSSPHLYKVIMNLVLNAMDAMSGGGRLVIKTESRHIDKLVGGYDNIEGGMYSVLTVSDSGVGIDLKDYRRIFEPFYTKKEMGRSGSGLGLAIVYGVVKDHNGYIDVHSEPEKGSDFILYFPATKDLAELDGPACPNIRGNEKVLVVDDVIEQRELAATVLGSLGYKVHIVADGHEAIDYLNCNEVDVVVLDMIMEPGFDGLDTYREIIKLHPGQKAIITSGFSETDRVKEAERLGVAKYIRKPYTMQKLGKAIREILGPPVETAAVL